MNKIKYKINKLVAGRLDATLHVNLNKRRTQNDSKRPDSKFLFFVQSFESE